MEPSDPEYLRTKNADAVIALMAFHGFTIPAFRLPLWRATKHFTGLLCNFPEESFTVLCTDGIVGYFLGTSGKILLGHQANFSGKVEPLFSKPKQPVLRPEKKTSSKKPIVSLLERALALLNET